MVGCALGQKCPGVVYIKGHARQSMRPLIAGSALRKRAAGMTCNASEGPQDSQGIQVSVIKDKAKLCACTLNGMMDCKTSVEMCLLEGAQRSIYEL